MTQTRITAHRYHDICYGHRVVGQGGKCEHLHGHNGRITFYCEAADGKLDDVGRVIDFSVIKQTLCCWVEANWDHKFLCWKEDPHLPILRETDPEGVVEVPFNPTSENMAQYLLDFVGPLVLMGSGITLVKVKFSETRKCGATVRKHKTC